MRALAPVLVAIAVILALSAFLVWNGNQPRDYPRYVAGGQGGPGVQWLVTVPCSHKPTGWQDARSACDFDRLLVVNVTPEVYAKYDQGSVYP